MRLLEPDSKDRECQEASRGTRGPIRVHTQDHQSLAHDPRDVIDGKYPEND